VANQLEGPRVNPNVMQESAADHDLYRLVAVGRLGRIAAAQSLFVKAALDVLAEVDGVLRSHPSFDRQEQDVVAWQIFPISGTNTLNHPLLEGPRDCGVVNLIAEEAVNRPAQDSISLASLETL
jgi:hypothetical protein